MLLTLLLALSPDCASEQPVTLSFKASDSMAQVASWASKNLCRPYSVDPAVAKRLFPLTLQGTVSRAHARALLEAALAAADVTPRTEQDGVVLGARVTNACDDAIPHIQVVDENARTVSRAAYESNWSACMVSAARIVPSLKDGAPNGLKLFAIRAESVWAALGFRNGDLLIRVNDRPLTSPDAALEAYTALRTADALSFFLERRGAPLTLTVTIDGRPTKKR